MQVTERSVYEIHNSRQRALLVVPTVFTFFAVLLTCLRIYGRRLQKSKVLTDDYLCILGCILGLVLLTSDYVMVVRGNFGNSSKNLKDPEDQKLWHKFLVVAYMTWIPAVGSVQLAILVLYLRIFDVITWCRRFCYVIVGGVFAWAVATFIADLTICTPVKKLWDPTVPGTCGPHEMVCTSAGIIHFIFDFTILLLPMPLIWNLHVSLVKKIAMSFGLVCGVFATIASILRLSCIIKMTKNPDPKDMTAGLWLAYVYHFSEVPIAIMCASIFCLNPVYQKHKSSISGSSLGKWLSYRSKDESTKHLPDIATKRSPHGNERRVDSERTSHS